MNYCIVKDGVIYNIIVCEDDQTAEAFGALPSSEGAVIGEKYSPPEPDPVEPETEPTVWDELDAAYQEGVDSV